MTQTLSDTPEINAARLIFATAYERANTDRQGRLDAAKDLLATVRKLADAENITAVEFGALHVVFGIRSRHGQIAIMMLDSGEFLSELEIGKHITRGPIDCLVYNPKRRAFDGVLNGAPTSDIEALTSFIVGKLSEQPVSLMVAAVAARALA